MVLVSIITPIYNSELYLHECIESVLNQTYSDFELLLIDDGSVDKSLRICLRYQRSDCRIKVFYQENRGVSSARNAGLIRMKGDFVTFLDSDDFLEPDFLEKLLDDYRSHPDIDLVYQNAVHLKTGSNRLLYQMKSELLSVHDFYKKYNVSTFGYAHAKLYKTSLIQQHRLTFDPCISFAEDCLFMVQYLSRSRTVYLSDRSNYNYRVRKNSLVTKEYPYLVEKNLYKTMRKALEVLLEKHGLPGYIIIQELEYPLLRTVRSNARIRDKSARLHNFRQLLDHNRKGIKNLIRVSGKNYFLGDKSLGPEFSEILDQAF